MTYYISQGRVETPIRRGGRLCCSSVEKLLKYLSVKTHQNTMWFDKVITFFAPQCTYMTIIHLTNEKVNKTPHCDKLTSLILLIIETLIRR